MKDKGTIGKREKERRTILSDVKGEKKTAEYKDT